MASGLMPKITVWPSREASLLSWSGMTLLTDVSGWFTEGYDTADFQVAKLILAELE